MAKRKALTGSAVKGLTWREACAHLSNDSVVKVA